MTPRRAREGQSFRESSIAWFKSVRESPSPWGRVNPDTWERKPDVAEATAPIPPEW